MYMYLNYLCAFISICILIPIFLSWGNPILACILTLIVGDILLLIAIVLNANYYNKPKNKSVEQILQDTYSFDFRKKSTCVITESQIKASGYNENNIDRLTYEIIDFYIPKEKNIQQNKNPCFATVPIFETPSENIETYWIAKNGSKSRKIIKANTLEGALFKLNLWARVKKQPQWSILKMTKFSTNKSIGIWKHNKKVEEVIL